MCVRGRDLCLASGVPPPPPSPPHVRKSSHLRKIYARLLRLCRSVISCAPSLICPLSCWVASAVTSDGGFRDGLVCVSVCVNEASLSVSLFQNRRGETLDFPPISRIILSPPRPLVICVCVCVCVCVKGCGKPSLLCKCTFYASAVPVFFC